MNKINLVEIPIEKSRSPRGRFRRLSQDVSGALTGLNGLGKAGQEQPLDVKLIRVPAGAVNWPYHSHSSRWELSMVISGRGQVRTPNGTFPLREGDCLLHPPGEPHHIRNTGAVDLVYYLVSHVASADICHFPDTNKWLLPGQMQPVKLQPADVYGGEE